MKKILIAEDDLQLCKIYKVSLQAAGFEIKIAQDGEEAIAALSTDFKPDLIILDMVMPKKDGYQVLKELKANPEWVNIPVIVHSNLSQAVEVEEVKAMGIFDYIVKSDASLKELIDKINSVP